ncbi:hypothetical protein [Paenarthrobacter nicotinovorans]|uniref:hypothetical protein n=1 Tax=Paenarthrobacter nicotinovorans TaxID=29320 RepID=UPI0011A1EC79|nr:hypothetical protein [Paenarthrobacter nicotinovorans]
MTPKRIIALAALAVVIIVIVVLALTRQTSRPTAPAWDPGSQPATVQPSPATTNPQATPPATGAADGDADKIQDTGESFVKMYASQRWDDPTPGAWTGRAAAYMTTDYARQTQEAYGRAGGAAWAEFVQQRQIRKPVIRNTAISASSPEKATVVVSYTVTTSSQPDPAGTSQDFTKLLSLRTENGHWKVSGITDLVSGYAPPTVEQQAPEVAPTVGH